MKRRPNVLSAARVALGGGQAERERLLAARDRALRRIVRHAYERVPYYRRLFDRHGVDPSGVRSPADLASMPITTKNDLRALALDEICARGVDPARLLPFRTSGSTGEPFVVRRSRLEEWLAVPFGLRALRAYGLRPTDKRAEAVRVRDPCASGGVLRKRSVFYRHLLVDSREPLDRILAVLRRYEPDLLGGFASVVAALAEAVTPEDRRYLHPRVVTTCSEVLTDAMRTQIEGAFRVPVYDLYGSEEFRLIAWECPDARCMHVCDDALVMEVIKDGRSAQPGEDGQVVITSLFAYGMPFIRYALDDVVTQGEETCPCGEPFSTIRNVRGRVMDYFRLPGGVLLHPGAVVSVILDAGWVGQYQLVQERHDSIFARVVPQGHPSDGERRRVEANVMRRLGHGVRFRMVFVPEIERPPAGKFRLALSLLEGADGDHRSSIRQRTARSSVERGVGQ